MEDRIRELEASLAWWKGHAEALDKNWEALKDKYLDAIRAALEMPDATVPEMVEAIRALKGGAMEAERAHWDEMSDRADGLSY